VATIGQFYPDTISLADLQSDFTAVVTPGPAETVPNLVGRHVTFNKNKDHFFEGLVSDHSGNQVTIEYSPPGSQDIAKYDGKYVVTIISPVAPEGNIKSVGKIIVDSST
jgi:hypothetical protein